MNLCRSGSSEHDYGQPAKLFVSRLHHDMTTDFKSKTRSLALVQQREEKCLRTLKAGTTRPSRERPPKPFCKLLGDISCPRRHQVPARVMISRLQLFISFLARLSLVRQEPVFFGSASADLRFDQLSLLPRFRNLFVSPHRSPFLMQ